MSDPIPSTNDNTRDGRLFASQELVARIERAGARFMADIGEHVAKRTTDDSPFVRRLAGGVATFTEVGSPLNKVIALGFDGQPAGHELDELEAAFAERGAETRIELSTLADPALAARLTDRGYRLIEFENVLGCALPAAGLPMPAAGIEVELSPLDEFDAWVDVIIDGFSVPDERGVSAKEELDTEIHRRINRDLAQVDGVSRMLARLDGEPAGASMLRVHRDIAHFCGAATLARHRRRGVQAALLAHRLDVAARAGCELAIVTTSPGSTSQQNVQRKGFELLYARAILVKPAPATP